MARYAMAVLRQTQNRLSEARIEVEKAIALDSNFALAHHSLGQTLLFMGQPDAAIPHEETALRLSPHDPVVSTFYWGLGACHLVLGRLDEAIDFLRQARAANPQLSAHHLWLAAALGLKGDLDEAKTALAESLKLNPGIDSVAHWRAQRPSYNSPAFWALLERTGAVGLRRAGLPDE
jgi:tetratricopeptide (TPR) repeat protein